MTVDTDTAHAGSMAVLGGLLAAGHIDPSVVVGTFCAVVFVSLVRPYLTGASGKPPDPPRAPPAPPPAVISSGSMVEQVADVTRAREQAEVVVGELHRLVP